MRVIHYFLFLILMFLVCSGNLYSQALPDILYYKFENNPNATSTPNSANPGSGNNPASLTGSTVLTPGGQFDSCITGNAATNGGVVTGWSNNFGSGSWTISMWLTIPSNTTGSALYIFGDPGNSFRCFHNGAAGQNNLRLTGTGITNVNVEGIGPDPTVVTFVYDSATATITAYKNGILAIAVPQTALNLGAGTGFKVGGYTTSATMSGKLDEFRVYKRALSGAEVLATWNIELGGGGSSQNFALRLPTPGVNTNYVAIPHQASMVGFTNYTIEAWMKPGSTVGANTVLNKGGASFDYQLGVNAGGVPFLRNQGTIAISTGLIIPAGVWTHLAATFDGTAARFYKDGVLASMVVLPSNPGSSANEMRIGRGNADPGTGNLKEVRLWSTARTQAQIDSNRCKKYPSTFSSSSGLKAVWHFDSTFVDSVSGYNGNPVGTVGFDTVTYPFPGVCSPTSINPIGSTIPEKFSLSQNYPNPFNPTTRIEFAIPRGEFVEIKLYDLLGKEVGILAQNPYEAGRYIIDFNAGTLSSGIYFYTITAGSFRDTKKMMLLK